MVDQSLEMLRGHVASIDRRTDEFVTKREFDQFISRFDAFERRQQEQFDRTRAAFDRASIGGADMGERSFRLAGNSIVSDASSLTIETDGLSSDERTTIARNMTEILAARAPDASDLSARDAASFLNLLGFDASAAGNTLVRVSTPR